MNHDPPVMFAGGITCRDSTQHDKQEGQKDGGHDHKPHGRLAARADTRRNPVSAGGALLRFLVHGGVADGTRGGVIHRFRACNVVGIGSFLVEEVVVIAEVIVVIRIVVGCQWLYSCRRHVRMCQTPLQGRDVVFRCHRRFSRSLGLLVSWSLGLLAACSLVRVCGILSDSVPRRTSFIMKPASCAMKPGAWP